MLQLIFHGIGDYYLQTDYQALNKKKKGKLGLYLCFKHCLTYSLPFLFIADWKAVIVIFLTHFAIDRTNLIAHFLAIKNNVNKWEVSEERFNQSKPTGKLVNDISNFGYGKERPFVISFWLYVITDNLTHIICNYLAITYIK